MIYRPDCQIIRPNPPHNLVSKAILELVYQEGSHKYNHFSGFHYLISEYSFIYEMIPDCIFLLQESHLRLKQGFSGSIITAKLSSRGTHTFLIEPNKTDVSCFPVVPPIYAISESILTIVLDEENRIQQLHIESLPGLEKPTSVI